MSAFAPHILITDKDLDHKGNLVLFEKLNNVVQNNSKIVKRIIFLNAPILRSVLQLCSNATLSLNWVDLLWSGSELWVVTSDTIIYAVKHRFLFFLFTSLFEYFALSTVINSIMYTGCLKGLEYFLNTYMRFIFWLTTLVLPMVVCD